MRSNKGITLTSLLIYVIGIMVIITIVATFTGYFTQNIHEVTIENIAEEQHSRFITYITKDINSEDITYVKTPNSNKNYVILYFKDGIEHQYVYSDGNMYFINIENDTVTKKITLCSGITSYSDDIFQYDNNVLSYRFNINSEEFSESYNINID